MNPSKPFSLLISFTVVAILSFAAQTQAAMTCRSLFGDSRFGHLRENFVLNTKYKVEALDQSEIKNQCNLGTCHLYSWVSQLERDLKVNTDKSIKISHHYLSVTHWIRESLAKLDGPANNEISVSLGADVLASRMSIFQSGIIPDQAWAGARDFHTGALSGRVTQYVQNVIAKAKWDISMQVDPIQQQQIRDQAKAQIVEIFENVVGKIPETFMYEGSMYTPKSFLRKFFLNLLQPVTVVTVAENRNAKTKLEADTDFFSVISTNLDVLEQTARELLDQGQTVYLAYDHNSDFVDVKTGVMSIGAFNLPPGGGPLSRTQRSFFNVEPGGHAVQLIGYDVDPKTNQVTQWKIKNSWGDKLGDAGYFHMYRDFFRAFVSGISYYSYTGITPEIQQLAPAQLEFVF